MADRRPRAVGQAGTIYAQIERSGAPALLLERYAGRLEYHTPWDRGREVSHLFRGSLDLAEAQRLLDERASSGCGCSTTASCSAPDEQMPGLPTVHAYHLIPAAASKATAVARHMQARGYAATDCIAVGDSREDLEVSAVVGAFWLVANALTRDPSLGEEIAGRPGVRLASEPLRRRRLRGRRHDPRGTLGLTPATRTSGLNARYAIPYAIPTGSS